MVNLVNNLPQINQLGITQYQSAKAEKSPQMEVTDHGSAMDTVTISRSEQTLETYSASLSPEKMIDQSYEMLRQLVVNMLEEQNIDFKVATGSSEIDISTLSQEEAQELVADDGYFGVEQTSNRIVDFAIAAAGGDAGRLDAIKEGVQAGFNEALEAFGGWLPEISYNTLDSVMTKLDDWAQGIESANG